MTGTLPKCGQVLARIGRGVSNAINHQVPFLASALDSLAKSNVVITVSNQSVNAIRERLHAARNAPDVMTLGQRGTR